MPDLDHNALRDRQRRTRNFSIVAHIDHGKSTLADRILQQTGTVSEREMRDQLLDSMALEQERGITIKLNAVELSYQAKDGQTYIFHLIDTPGHVDFAYEVSRSLAACEGAVLVVDATQGVEAQTLANAYLAVDNDLEIVPVINKIDLPSAQPEVVKEEIEDIIGIEAETAPLISAKTGVGIGDVLEKIVQDVPAPTGDLDAPLQALIFDSVYDPYRGVVLSIRVKNGMVKKGDRIQLMNSGKTFDVTEVGIMSPHAIERDVLIAGDVGYLTASIKTIQDTKVGDTVTNADRPADKPLQGYRPMHPMVYSGLYPVESKDYADLREALEKLQLNDASLTFEPESSQALGFGFRCGFLGMLHMDVTQERLERDFGINLIITAPSVIYHAYQTDGTMVEVSNPSELPDATEVHHIEEPYVKAEIMVPEEYIGTVIELAQGKRGQFINIEYLDDIRVKVVYEMPLAEVIYNFFDQLKSGTKGYASLDYSLIGYRESQLVKLDVLIHGEVIDALSTIIHRDFANSRGRQLVDQLKTVIPRQQFEIPIQAAIGHKIISRSTVKAYRKDVTAKLYGGDVTRRQKLLNKQKEGKKRMKAIGSVDVPQDAFLAVLNMDEDANKK
ncbi:MAG: translation elongation factor 4 [Aerococcus sp.]|nr:translation elongation factor 4 [Aerococcus sp.]